MADQYLTISGNRKTMVSATVSSAGAANAGDIVALDTDGYLSLSVLPTGVGPDTKTIVASETLTAGNLVNIWNDSGTPKVRKADATAAGKEADGFILTSVDSAANALVYFEGVITGLTSLTVGARYYLNTTAGGITTTPGSSAGNVLQYVGRAISATELSFEPDDGVVL
jgi:hypothetical protein